MSMRRGIGVIAATMVMVAVMAEAADWPQFGGPQGNLVSPETGLMKQWPADGPRECWSVDLGPGFGGAAVHDGEVFILDREPAVRDILRCLDLQTGRELWRYQYAAEGKLSFPGSRSHPAVDKDAVYILSPFGELRCVSRSSHKPVWTRNILKTFGGKQPHWAFSQSPALYGDTVIVVPATGKAGMVAYKKATGERAWKSEPFGGKMGYGSAMPATIDGVDQFLAATGNRVVGVEAATGTILWSNSDWTCKTPCSGPAYLKNGLVLMTGGYGAGSIMVRAKKQGAAFTSSTVFKTMECNSQIRQPILVGDHVYLNGNDKSKKYGLMCMTLDGTVKWQTGRDPGFDWGGLLYADGMIYTVDGTKGDLVMVQPDPDAYREIGRANFLSGKQQWATIAISDGKILLRDQTALKCVDVRGR